MTLQEKIIELLPKRAGADDNAHHPQESEEEFYSYNNGYNKALSDIESLLPKMIEVVREDVAESERERCIEIIETYKKHSTHNPEDTCLDNITQEINSI